MAFKRRDRRPMWKIITAFFWPKGGWTRAFYYVRHRLNRLPDPPHRIARGIFAGVFTTFTPFYGLHFLTAALVAWVLRGNIPAALLGTFFGNPLTYVPIGVVSLQTGYAILGRRGPEGVELGRSLAEKFIDAGDDLKNNFLAIFMDHEANWQNLHIFYNEVFFPYMVGGIIPGIIAGLVCYYLSLPVITAYQKRRKGALKAKWFAMKEKKALKEKQVLNADRTTKPD